MENVKLPLALVAAMAVQLAAGVWWVSQQAATIAGLEDFQIGWAMIVILGFYFGAGAAEGFMDKKKAK